MHRFSEFNIDWLKKIFVMPPIIPLIIYNNIENNTHKTNRVSQNEDLAHMLLVSSDLYISSLNKNSKINVKPLDEDMRALIIIDFDENNYSDSNSDDDSDSE
jgi:hypothetical protein